jgi:bifunctional non-homologous end joining protein LigD
VPLAFVVQKHQASHLHYDFRLECDGTLKSWAIPKGPSLDPAIKRLAMAVEDHPLEYAQFEGVIPEGEYGGGTVMVWDQGTYVPENPDVGGSWRRGELKFALAGRKLRGSWTLVRTRMRGERDGQGRSWLLIKHRDFAAAAEDITLLKPCSARSGRSLAQIAADEGGDPERAAAADPAGARRCRRRAAAGAVRSRRGAGNSGAGTRQGKIRAAGRRAGPERHA